MLPKKMNFGSDVDKKTRKPTFMYKINKQYSSQLEDKLIHL